MLSWGFEPKSICCPLFRRCLVLPVILAAAFPPILGLPLILFPSNCIPNISKGYLSSLILIMYPTYFYEAEAAIFLLYTSDSSSSFPQTLLFLTVFLLVFP